MHLPVSGVCSLSIDANGQMTIGFDITRRHDLPPALPPAGIMINPAAHEVCVAGLQYALSRNRCGAIGYSRTYVLRYST